MHHRNFEKDFTTVQGRLLKVTLLQGAIATVCTAIAIALIGPSRIVHSSVSFLLGLPLLFVYCRTLKVVSDIVVIHQARRQEEALRSGKKVLGAPPQRDCFAKALLETREAGKKILDRYLIGFELETGAPLWVSDDGLCTHAAVFAKTGVGKTLWLESLLMQQMLRGRASGSTFIDAKRDSGTLAHIIYMAHLTGRIEDLIIIDPLNPLHSYNFVATSQRADVKARKLLRAGLPPIADASSAKHYDRLAADAVFRIVRALDSIGLSWSIEDVAAALGSFAIAYPHLKAMLQSVNATDALLDLAHFASTYRTPKGGLDIQKLTDNVRGIASELHSIAAGDAGDLFCAAHSDLCLTTAIKQGKLIYFMMPRLEESEGAARMLKVFREDLEVSIGEITSNDEERLEDPHLVMVDEGASTFSPTWANLFELARKGRFALLFGAQSTAGLSDRVMGLSAEFYDRVIANVNLQVVMRIGDNKTANELSEWLGKTTVDKKTVSHSKSKGSASSATTPLFDATAKRQSGRSYTESTFQEEEDFVPPDELKYGLQSEKGLAWVDLGGKLTKMRALWVDFSLPKRWTGRDTVPLIEPYERNKLDLAKWVEKELIKSELQLNEEPPQKPGEISAAPSPVPDLPPSPNEPFRLSFNAPISFNPQHGNILALNQSPQTPPQKPHHQRFLKKRKRRK
ncbi:MAG: TraM recognition domain-containing protein [Myxacorys californica WJT36-NPBG1]|nr:TraM recognition domain-containing protein [Myxacorys californica WJT36-NPBG1]